MTQLTPEADARLEEYLRRVRAAVAGCAGVDPDEVEADVREHIAAEFAAAAGPVGAAELEGVLARLGPPSQWAAAADPKPTRERLAEEMKVIRAGVRQVLRGIAGVLWRGPEDWRLPYLAFAAFALFAVNLPRMSWSWGPLAYLVLAYILARAAVAFSQESGVTLGARRWLLYPPLVLVSASLLTAAGFWPLSGGFAAGNGVAAAIRVMDRPEQVWASVAHESLDRRLGQSLMPHEDQYQAIRQHIKNEWVHAEAKLKLEAALNDAEFAAKYVNPIPGSMKTKPFVAMAFTAAGLYALWGMIAGGLVMAFPRLPGMVFAPFLSGVTAGHGRRLFEWSAFAFLVWCVGAYCYLEKAGVV